MSNKISGGDAQTQFGKAALSLKTKSRVCFILTIVFFIALVSVLLWFTFQPPRLIGAIVDAMMPGSKQAEPPCPCPF
jgi:hypothetical protein